MNNLAYLIVLIYYTISMKVKAKTIGQFKVIDHLLGEGMMGKVYLGQKIKQPGVYIAVKEMEINLGKADDQKTKLKHKQIENQIMNSSKLESPYIVKLISYARTQNHLYMFLEFCEDGDLKNYIKKKAGRLSESEALVFFRHIVEGFKELWKHSIIHRDIKPANILLKQGIAKISDFGFSRVVEKLQESAYFTNVGTPLYTSPQILRKEKFSSKCDVWSVGIAFYEMLYGKTPWTGTDLNNLTQNIVKNELQFKLPVRSEAVKDLLRKMLQVQEKQRISWPQIFQHPLCKQKILNIKEVKSDYNSTVKLFIEYLNINVVKGYLKSQINYSQKIESELGKLEPNEIVLFRQKMLKVFTKLIYQRNIAFFFNYILGLYYRNAHKLPQKLNKNSELEFVLVKTAKDLIQSIARNYFVIQCPAEYTKDLWFTFKGTNQFNSIKTLLEEDYRILSQMLKMISQRIKEIYIQSKGAQRIAKNMDQMNGQLFKNIYVKVLAESVEVLKKHLEKQTENDLAYLVKEYLEIAYNPMNYFSSQDFDFHSFYENNQIKHKLM